MVVYTEIRNVKKAADAGNAVAIALSGAMFLPDKKFDLTANVGTYAGAFAGAVQIAARVSREWRSTPESPKASTAAGRPGPGPGSPWLLI